LSAEVAVTSESSAETEALGARLAVELAPGDVVLVSGELGSGKTTLIRGACGALGVSGPVVSPTFTIGRRYRGRVPVSHLDLYRLERLDAEDPGLLDDYLTPDAVSFVEWPAVAGQALDRDGVRVARLVELRHGGGDRREITVSTPVAARANDQ
jgi:tRNA threonylcarbamoyladenosine biosynthesis protein TsaE